MVQSPWKTFWQFLVKLSAQLLYNNCSPEHLPLRSENLCSCKNLWLNVHNHFIHSSLELWTTQMPFDGWMAVKSVVHPHRGILLSNRKEQTIDMHINLDDSPGNQAEWKTPRSKGYITHDSIHVALLKSQNFRNGKEMSGCQGSGTVREEKTNVALKVQQRGSLWWRDCSAPWLYQYTTLVVILEHGFARCYLTLGDTG